MKKNNRTVLDFNSIFRTIPAIKFSMPKNNTDVLRLLKEASDNVKVMDAITLQHDVVSNTITISCQNVLGFWKLGVEYGKLLKSE